MFSALFLKRDKNGWLKMLAEISDVIRFLSNDVIIYSSSITLITRKLSAFSPSSIFFRKPFRKLSGILFNTTRYANLFPRQGARN